MRFARLLWFAGLLLPLGCTDPVSVSDLGRSYILSTVEGQPVPFATDSVAVPSGNTVLFRIWGRSVEFISRDSAQYTWGTDVVERMPDGQLQTRAAECTSQRVTYTRKGDEVVLTIHPVLVSTGPFFPPPPPPTFDTLFVEGAQLVQQETIDVGSRRRIARLEYQQQHPVTPVCDGIVPS